MRNNGFNHQAILNCCEYICQQPTVTSPNEGGMLVMVHEPQYESLAKLIQAGIAELYPQILVKLFDSSSQSSETVISVLKKASLSLFMYDKYTGDEIHINYADAMKPYGVHIENNLGRCCFMIDALQDFNEIYSIAPSRTYALNSDLVALATNTQKIVVTDHLGSEFYVELESDNKWLNLNGRTHQDILPSEVFSYRQKISGTWYFTGAILSKVPFSLKYGVIMKPIKFMFKDGFVTDYEAQDEHLQQDLDYYFKAHPNHKSVEEIGIGTNEGIKKLAASNAPHEERHPGIHIGIGGEQTGTSHIDLISNACHFHFDDRLIFDGSFQL